MLPELLAPAGDRSCAYAALEYGADALYLGLRRFSARADAVNFTPDELSEVVDYAHRMKPARRVYATFNTLLQNGELAEALETLALLEDLGVDAVIVQDLGVIRLIRRGFPRLRLHASTQMAIHEASAVDTLADWGFSRVTLARELTLDEIQAIKRRAAIEIEVFAHGALCYAYSGLCLYSSLLRGRSGNRGRCAYPCRGSIRWGAGSRYSFSMKDLALEEQVRKLAEAGVDSVKIEGRKKSPLYVAAATALYRRILDGAARAEIENRSNDVRSIFSRSRTALCLDRRHAPEVTDDELVGHRGRPIGMVREVRRLPGGRAELLFKTNAPLERHDGLQVDLPVEQGKPFGFAVDRLRQAARPAGPFRETVRAPAGDWVGVELPPHYPDMGPGLEVYCAASQSVRRAYPVTCPRPGEFRVRHPLAVQVDLAPDRIRFTLASAKKNNSTEPAAETWEFPGSFEKCREPADQTPIFQKAFARVADFPYTVSALTVRNPSGLFCPISRINEWRRTVLAEFQERAQARLESRLAVLGAEPIPVPPRAPSDVPPRRTWSLKIERPADLDAFSAEDAAGLEEVILNGSERLLKDPESVSRLVQRIQPVRVRLALPIILRGTEAVDRVARLVKLAATAGIVDWQAGHLGAKRLLAQAGAECRSLSADWNLYGLNRQAVANLLDAGFSGVTASPEDDADNLLALVAEFPEYLHLPVYHTVPLFISEHCPQPCRKDRSCETCEREGTAGNGSQPEDEEPLRIVHRDGLTLTLSRRAFAFPPDFRKQLVAAGARHFRAEFCWRPYTSDEVCGIWRHLLKGEAIPDTETGNLRRGLK